VELRELQARSNKQVGALKILFSEKVGTLGVGTLGWATVSGGCGAAEPGVLARAAPLRS
jgi:hypothetical protein